MERRRRGKGREDNEREEKEKRGEERRGEERKVKKWRILTRKMTALVESCFIFLSFVY